MESQQSSKTLWGQDPGEEENSEWPWSNFSSRGIWKMQLRGWKPSRSFTYRARSKKLYSGPAKESGL